MTKNQMFTNIISFLSSSYKLKVEYFCNENPIANPVDDSAYPEVFRACSIKCKDEQFIFIDDTKGKMLRCYYVHNDTPICITMPFVDMYAKNVPTHMLLSMLQFIHEGKVAVHVNSILTKQEIFDKIRTHLEMQNKRCGKYDKFIKRFKCRYYNGNDRCAVGCLILPEFYSDFLEDQSLAEKPLLEAIYKSVGRVLTAEELEMLEDLRTIHDYHEVYEWDSMFYQIAKKYNLTVKVQKSVV